MHGRDYRLHSLLFLVRFIVYLVVVPGADAIVSERNWIKFNSKACFGPDMNCSCLLTPSRQGSWIRSVLHDVTAAILVFLSNGISLLCWKSSFLISANMSYWKLFFRISAHPDGCRNHSAGFLDNIFFTWHGKVNNVEEKVVVIHRGRCNNKVYYRLSHDVVTW